MGKFYHHFYETPSVPRDSGVPHIPPLGLYRYSLYNLVEASIMVKV